MAWSPCMRSLLNLARRGLPHLSRRRPRGHQPGPFDARPEYHRPAECLTDPHVRVMWVTWGFLAGDLRPAESDDLAGNPRRGEGGRECRYLGAAAVFAAILAAAALITA